MWKEGHKMNQIKKILCPYDGTYSSQKVFRNILYLAKCANAEILLLTCIEDRATFGFFKSKSDKKIINKQKQKANEKIEKLKLQAQEREVLIKSKIVKCDIVSKEIINYAKKEKVDMIVMNQTNRGTVAEKMYNESTVEKVFKDSPCTFIHIK